MTNNYYLTDEQLKVMESTAPLLVSKYRELQLQYKELLRAALLLVKSTLEHGA